MTFHVESSSSHLEMVDALLVVNVDAEDLGLGGDDGAADVDDAVGAAAGQVGRGLAVRQHPVVEDEVPARKLDDSIVQR